MPDPVQPQQDSGFPRDGVPAPDSLIIWWCPHHGETRHVIGMGAGRSPRCAIVTAGEPCGLEAPKTRYVRQESPNRWPQEATDA